MIRRFFQDGLHWVAVGGLIIGAALYYSTPANANPDIGCQSVPWGFLGSQTRTICDGPIQADGSWTRVRAITWPSRYVSGYCSRYYCNPGYWTDAGGYREVYPVNPTNVLPDEPGHLDGVGTLR